MSVVGIGNDLVEIARFAQMNDALKQRFAKRILTPAEYERYQETSQSDNFLAKRWAAKEAASKALGTGIAQGITFQQFEITNLPSGQPILHLTDKALEIATTLGANHWHITLSDERAYALAFVVLSL